MKTLSDGFKEPQQIKDSIQAQDLQAPVSLELLPQCPITHSQVCATQVSKGGVFAFPPSHPQKTQVKGNQCRGLFTQISENMLEEGVYPHCLASLGTRATEMDIRTQGCSSEPKLTHW